MTVQTEQTPRPSKEASVHDTEGLAQRRTGLPVRMGEERTAGILGKERIWMEEKSFMTVEEVATELRVSKFKAYQIVRKLNAELQKQGYMTVAGRENTTFFHKKVCYSD